MAFGSNGKPRGNGFAQRLALGLSLLGTIAAGLGGYYRIHALATNNAEEITELRGKIDDVRRDLEQEIEDRGNAELKRLEKELDDLRHSK